MPEKNTAHQERQRILDEFIPPFEESPVKIYVEANVLSAMRIYGERIESRYTAERKTTGRLLKSAERIFTADGFCGCGVYAWKAKHDSPCWCSIPASEDLRQAIVECFKAAHE